MRQSSKAIGDESSVRRSSIQCNRPSAFGVLNCRRKVSVTTNLRNMQPYRATEPLGSSETR